jgi:hypothetical protein
VSVTGEVHEVIAAPVVDDGAHEKVTVTSERFQPAPFGGGDIVALMCGPDTAKATPLLACPSTVTTTGPFVAVSGTTAAIEESPQLVAIAPAPLNVTVLEP